MMLICLSGAAKSLEAAVSMSIWFLDDILVPRYGHFAGGDAIG